MGATFQNLAVPTSNMDEVKKLLSRWLSAKGFDLRQDKPLFECDENSERGLCLFGNDRWVVILYSNMLHEGERLLFELGKLGMPVLQVWAFDSDIWGYDLYVKNELATSFNSNPSYFGRFAEEPSPNGGDPELLCRLLPIEVEEEDIAKIQRGRALFKEWVCRRFCKALGIAPAGVDFREIEEISLNPGTRKIGEFRMDEMYFVSKNHDSTDEKIDLHKLSVARTDPAVSAEQMQFDLPSNLRALVLFFRIVSWIVWPAVFFLTLFFRLYFRIQRISFLGKPTAQFSPTPEGQFFTDLYQLQTPSSRIEGRALINDRHRFRLTLPEAVHTDVGAGARWLFGLRVDGHQIIGRCLRPSQLPNQLKLRAGMNLVEDTKFFVKELPARIVTFRTSDPRGKERFHYLYFIQEPQAIYEFSLESLEPIPAETAARIRDMIESFEII
jgi:hypothetical protein